MHCASCPASGWGWPWWPPSVGSRHEAAAPLAARSPLFKMSGPWLVEPFFVYSHPLASSGCCCTGLQNYVRSEPPISHCHLATMLFLPTAQTPVLGLALGQVMMGSCVGTIPLSSGVSTLPTLPWCLCLGACPCPPNSSVHSCDWGQLDFP